MTAMPKTWPRQGSSAPGWRPVAVAAAVFLVVAVLVAAAVLLVVNPFRAAEIPTTDCTRYGLCLLYTFRCV